MSLESFSEFLVILFRMIAFCDIIGIIGIVFVLLDKSGFKEKEV